MQLTPWMLQTFHANPPVDLGRAHPRIDRKDAKFRWASYSRVPPRLNNMAKHSSNQVVAPPFGIQLTSIVSTLDTGDFRPHHLNNPSETLRGCTGWIHRCFVFRDGFANPKKKIYINLVVTCNPISPVRHPLALVR